MKKKNGSFYVRVLLPAQLAQLPRQRELLAQLLVRVAANFSFQGLEDWTVDLPTHVKVLGIEREFHDLTQKGRMNDEVRVYFGQKEEAATYRKLLTGILGEAKILGPIRLAERDWMKAWRKHYQPVHFREGGVSLSVVPAWRKAQGKGLSVRIYPGQAFGTGTHPTTRLCLRLFLRHRELLPAKPSTLDFGAGTGILAFSAAKVMPGLRLRLVESDPDALAQARKNARINRMRASFALRPKAGQKFDLVFANVLSPVLLQEKKQLRAALRPGGLLLLSGILRQDGKKFLRAFRQPGLAVAEELIEGDWTSFALVRTR